MEKHAGTVRNSDSGKERAEYLLVYRARHPFYR